MEGKDLLKGLGMFIGIIAIVFLVIFFFWLIILGLAILFCIIIIAIIVVLVIVALVLIFAIPYFAITKKPEVQRYESYDLDEVSGRHEEKGTDEQSEYKSKRHKETPRKKY